jgi:uncharacterized membrane protein YciS (DUF1049 family)
MNRAMVYKTSVFVLGTSDSATLLRRGCTDKLIKPIRALLSSYTYSSQAPARDVRISALVATAYSSPNAVAWTVASTFYVDSKLQIINIGGVAYQHSTLQKQQLPQSTKGWSTHPNLMGER